MHHGGYLSNYVNEKRSIKNAAPKLLNIVREQGVDKLGVLIEMTRKDRIKNIDPTYDHLKDPNNEYNI